jgi:hypothetical protein
MVYSSVLLAHWQGRRGQIGLTDSVCKPVSEVVIFSLLVVNEQAYYNLAVEEGQAFYDPAQLLCGVPHSVIKPSPGGRGN